MDQLASFLGIPGKLTPIVCQPDLVKTAIEIPSQISFMGIDSGVRHSVDGASYGEVRCAAFMGYSIIAEKFGSDNSMLLNFNGNRKMLPYDGYLCNITTKEFEEKYKSFLPLTIIGKEFISDFGKTIDHVTTVVPDINYKIYNCSQHPVYENERVQ